MVYNKTTYVIKWLECTKKADNQERQPASNILIIRELTYATLQTNLKEFLSFHRKLHRQLVEHFFGVAVYDKCHRCLGADTSLVAVKNLIFADFGGSCLVLNG